MAATHIMPPRSGKGCTDIQAVSGIIDYAADLQKTENGRRITGYGYDSRTADAGT